MSSDHKLNQLNGATRECLQRCYRSGNWLATLASYAEQLRADGWSRADIEEVEATVRRILRAIGVSDSVYVVNPSPNTQAQDMASR